MKPTVRCALVLSAAAVLVSACTSSSGTPSATASPSAGTNTVGAGSTVPSGPGAGSAPAGSDTYTAPVSAPYPTPQLGGSTPATQASVLASLPGSASSSCAQVGRHTDLRSGSVGMGNFQEAKVQFAGLLGKTEVPELNVYVIPEHTKSLKSATVRVQPSGGGKASTVRTTSIEQLEPYQYFALKLPVPKAGAYRVTVTSGEDHGCFLVSFAK